MFKFRKSLRKNFKTEEAYLKDIYHKNIGRIPEGVTEEQFVNQVKAYKLVYKTNITGALKKLSNTEDYTPYKERAYDNVMVTLKKYGKYKQFKQMIRDEKGRFMAYNPDLMSWRPELHMYVYNNLIAIDIRNSPESVEVYKI